MFPLECSEISTMKNVLFLLLFLFLSSGCNKALVKDSSLQRQVFSLQKLNCEGCGGRVARVLRKQPGVTAVSFEKTKVELSVTWKKKLTNAETITKTITGLGFVALQGPGKGAYNPPAKFPKSMDVQKISKQGELVLLEKHLAKGKVTVFDFFAVWCGPCKDVDQELLKLMTKHRGIALRKLNIVSWDKPITKKYLKNVKQLPYLVIYDQNGKKVKTITGRKLKLLRETILSLISKAKSSK